MRDKRPLWISLLAVVAIAVVSLSATLAAGWTPKLGLDLAGGLSVVYETHTPVTSAELDTIITILNERVGSGSSGATVASQGSSKCPDGTHSCALIGAAIPGQKNTQQILQQLGKTAQLFFRPALCFAPGYSVAKGAAPATGWSNVYTFNAPGTYTITVYRSGDGTYARSNAASAMVTVSAAPTAMPNQGYPAVSVTPAQ